MPNTFEYADWLAMESLELLESKRSVSQFFNTEYSSEFKLKFPVGDTIRIPYPDQGRIRTGLTYNPTAIARRHATISFQDPFGTDFEWDSAEEALKAPRGREKVSREILEPRMALLAQEIDSRCALFAYQNAASVVGSLGTMPTSYDATSAAARQVMQELACPNSGDRGMIVPPKVMRSIKGSNIGLFNPVPDLSKTFRDGLQGMSDGFEWYESMSLYRHTAGTWQGAVTLTTTLTDGATSAVLTCTTGDTFKAGDKISFASSYPVHPLTRRTFGTDYKTVSITADATGASSSATVTFAPPLYGPLSTSQNVDALPVAGCVVTLWPGTPSPNGKVGTVGLALHNKIGFGLVSVELEEPKASSVELVSQKRDPDSGVAIRFIRQWDGRTSKMINRFDVMIGLGYFYCDAGAVAVACG